MRVSHSPAAFVSSFSGASRRSDEASETALAEASVTAVFGDAGSDARSFLDFDSESPDLDASVGV
ncbi:MAG: hypothetical protein AAFU85_08595 [Planctomycetota bacterium]